MAILIETNNKKTDFTLEDTFEKRRRQFVERLKTDEFDIRPVGKWTMICDDVGIMKGLPFNKRATSMYQMATGSDNPVHGDVIFYEAGEIPGDRPGYTEDQDTFYPPFHIGRDE